MVNIIAWNLRALIAHASWTVFLVVNVAVEDRHFHNRRHIQTSGG